MPSREQLEQEKLVRENTEEMMWKRWVGLYYSNIDYMTIKLADNSTIIQNLREMSPERDRKVIREGEFIIRFESIIYGWSWTVLRIYDNKGNKIWCIHIKNEVLKEDGTKKTNTNISTDVEFTGDFWKMYSDQFPFFCDYFGIDPKKEWLVKRMDYCIDIGGIDCNDFFNFYRRTDLEKNWSMNQSPAFYLWDRLTSWTDMTDRHELQIYNKKIEILNPLKNKQKIKTNSWEKPYLKYIREDFEITRIEYRSMSRAMRESKWSINYCFEYAQQLMVSYIKKYYLLDIWLLFSDFTNKKFPRKKDKLVSNIVGKKAYMAGRMIEAYCDNLRDYRSEKHVFDLLQKIYGDRLQDHLFRNFPTEENKKWWI